MLKNKIHDWKEICVGEVKHLSHGCVCVCEREGVSACVSSYSFSSSAMLFIPPSCLFLISASIAWISPFILLRLLSGVPSFRESVLFNSAALDWRSGHKETRRDTAVRMLPEHRLSLCSCSCENNKENTITACLVSTVKYWENKAGSWNCVGAKAKKYVFLILHFRHFKLGFYLQPILLNEGIFFVDVYKKLPAT